MLRNYQERERIKVKEPPTYQIAICGPVSGSTARINFATGLSQKYYKIINSVAITQGQRIKIQKTNGTYIITGVV